MAGRSRASRPANLQRVVQVGAWLGCLLPMTWLAVCLRRRRTVLVTDQPAEHSLAKLSETLAWVGLTATAYTLFTVVTASVCL